MPATDARQVADLYQATRARIAELLTPSDPAVWARPVAACPGWSVRDVVSHLTAVAEDWADGRLSGAPTDEETAEHVRRYDSHDDATLLKIWSDMGTRLHDLAGSEGLEPPLGASRATNTTSAAPSAGRVRGTRRRWCGRPTDCSRCFGHRYRCGFS